jgi:hypothetical protein
MQRSQSCSSIEGCCADDYSDSDSVSSPSPCQLEIDNSHYERFFVEAGGIKACVTISNMTRLALVVFLTSMIHAEDALDLGRTIGSALQLRSIHKVTMALPLAEMTSLMNAINRLVASWWQIKVYEISDGQRMVNLLSCSNTTLPVMMVCVAESGMLLTGMNEE